jgi:hypothetical protein
VNLSPKKILTYFAIYEVAAYAWNSYQVSRPSVAGQAASYMLPFDLISSVVGYAGASNPTVVTPSTAVGAYMPVPAQTYGLAGALGRVRSNFAAGSRPYAYVGAQPRPYYYPGWG